MTEHTKQVVKVLSKGNPEVGAKLWQRQLASSTDAAIEYTFDPNRREYDWLVVYDDLPSVDGQRYSTYREELACRPDHTILVTAEPSSIKLYGSDFCSQFGWVFSSQEPWAIRHPRHVQTQLGLRWFYGHGANHTLSFEQISNKIPLKKTQTISCVCSSKAHRHTLHHQRVTFVNQLKPAIAELKVFGHGVCPIDDKAESLDPFRYHVAIENHQAPHHWTEKLSDSFLGCVLPFYFGAPDAADYFPADSFIPIDIRQPEEAIRIIRSAIDNNEYEKRLPAILEARSRVLNQHQLFPAISNFIVERSQLTGELRIKTGTECLVSRRLARQGIVGGLRHFREQVTNRTLSAIGRFQKQSSTATIKPENESLSEEQQSRAA